MSKRFIYIFPFLVSFVIILNTSAYSEVVTAKESGFSRSGHGCNVPVLLPPELKCVSVLANGNVTLSWKEVLDTAFIFNSYHIFSSTSSSGPFTEIDSIFSISQTTYTDINANANLSIIYYYIKTRTNCSGSIYSAPSDTLQTIKMNAVYTGIGTAALTWNSIHNPNLSTSLGWYHIYKEYPFGTWTMIDSTQSLNYTDTITVCHAKINYYVDIDDLLPCTSVSSIDSDIFEDRIAPIFPVIDSVSVNQVSGHSVIGWKASPSGDTKGYIIYENENSIWVPIDTVMGRTTTFYINSKPHWSNPDSSSLSYCIAAFDSCKNTSRLDTNQSTIYLTSVYDICGRSATLNWTPYINMPHGLKGYNVYVSQNFGPMTLLATNSSSNLSFTQSSLANNTTYIYSVRAFNNPGSITSTSNEDTVYAYAPPKPKFVYLRYATVINSDYINIKALIDTSGYS